ncbi:MAG: DNA glycosylase AlkZ-like family protein [Acidimicrobiia bacterium]
MSSTLEGLRALAVSGSLGRKTTLRKVIDRLGFVQYDPVRRPARAQDLILHQRVAGYRAGDLDRRYQELGLDEDHLHVYGAMPASVSGLLHPRLTRSNAEYEPSGLCADVFAMVVERGPTHPSDLTQRFGRVSAGNDWGGRSAATTRALEELHFYGLLRVLHRDNGTKVYEPAAHEPQHHSARERVQLVALLIGRALAPISEGSLRSTVAQYCHNSRVAQSSREVVDQLIHDDMLRVRVVDGVRYLLPPGFRIRGAEQPREVRFVAPFDPIVWDRQRFEHLWGWQYRFEAYMPAAKRRFGYYALPMFWGHDAIGWVNCERTAAGSLAVSRNFIDGFARTRRFEGAFDIEVSRMESMLDTMTKGNVAP